jgi:hypothetical protein
MIMKGSLGHGLRVLHEQQAFSVHNFATMLLVDALDRHDISPSSSRNLDLRVSLQIKHELWLGFGIMKPILSQKLGTDCCIKM